jgi:uncharacterized protein YqjF (DUF2071 family)
MALPSPRQPARGQPMGQTWDCDSSQAPQVRSVIASSSRNGGPLTRAIPLQRSCATRLKTHPPQSGQPSVSANMDGSSPLALKGQHQRHDDLRFCSLKTIKEDSADSSFSPGGEVRRLSTPIKEEKTQFTTLFPSPPVPADPRRYSPSSGGGLRSSRQKVLLKNC